MRLFLGLGSWASNKGMQTGQVQNLQLLKLGEKGLFGRRLRRVLLDVTLSNFALSYFWSILGRFTGCSILSWGLISGPTFFYHINWDFRRVLFLNFVGSLIFIVCVLLSDSVLYILNLFNKVEQVFSFSP